MAGLTDIFTTGGGHYESFMNGQDRAIKQQQSLEEMFQKRLQNQHTGAMNPLLQQQQSLANQTTSAQLPGVRGDSQVKASAGKIAEATTPQMIQSKMAELTAGVGKAQLQQLYQQAEAMGALSARWDDLPAEVRPVVLKQQGFSDADITRFSRLTGPQLRQVADTIAMSNPEHVRKMAENTHKEDEAFRRSKLSADTQLAVADKYASRPQGSSGAKEKTRWVELNMIPAEQRSPEQQAEFERLTDFIITQRAVASNALAPEMLGGGQPTTPTERAGEAVNRIAGQAQRQAPQTLNDLKQLYPGRSDEELRAAYKRKFGKEIN